MDAFASEEDAGALHVALTLRKALALALVLVLVSGLALLALAASAALLRFLGREFMPTFQEGKRSSA